MQTLVNEELKQYFRPEFLNRLDEIIVFRQLTKGEVKEIADIMLKEVFVRAEGKGIKIDVTERFKVNPPMTIPTPDGSSLALIAMIGEHGQNNSLHGLDGLMIAKQLSNICAMYTIGLYSSQDIA